MDIAAEQNSRLGLKTAVERKLVKLWKDHISMPQDHAGATRAVVALQDPAVQKENAIEVMLRIIALRVMIAFGMNLAAASRRLP
jgi:hypothetical protein